MDLQHLWYGRRSSTRVRSELMAAIYDKALKRKDYSGIVNKEEGSKDNTSNEEVNKTDSKSTISRFLIISNLMLRVGKKREQKKSQKEKDATADDPRAGADVGKIVNLMSGDTNRVSSIHPGKSDILIRVFRSTQWFQEGTTSMEVSFNF